MFSMGGHFHLRCKKIAKASESTNHRTPRDDVCVSVVCHVHVSDLLPTKLFTEVLPCHQFRYRRHQISTRHSRTFA